MNGWAVYGAGSGFLLGVLVATLTPLSGYFAGALLIAALGVFVYGRGSGTMVRTGGKVILTVLVASAVGVQWYTVTLVDHRPLDDRIGEDVELVGTVVREVESRGETSTVIVSSNETRVRVTAPRYPEYRYGDRLELTGRLEEPDAFETETGRVFAYDAYLAKDGIFYTMYYPVINRIEHGAGYRVMSWLLGSKRVLMNGIERVLTDPHAALANGILLGVEQSLGDRLEEAFRNTGLIHIVVLSGYNVTLVAVAVMSVLKHLRVGLTTRSVLGILGIVAFAFLVGLGATVVRASIMAVLVVIAHALGRRSDMLRALVVAAVIMVVINPLILVHDPSFQLSAIATFGLITLSPIIERWLLFVPTAGGLREIVTATVATQIAVLPLLVYMVGTFSLVSVPVNVLALPAVAPAMLFSFLAGLVGIVSRTLALPLAALAYLLLGYILFVVETFNALPFSHVFVPPTPVWVPVVLYVLLGVGLLVAHRRGTYELGIPSLAERLR